MTIPERYWYPADEACQLRCCSRSYLDACIRDGRRAHPGPDAIRPEQIRHVGRRITIHRSWVTGEPMNVRPMRQSPQITEQIADTIAERVALRLFERMTGAIAPVRRIS